MIRYTRYARFVIPLLACSAMAPGCNRRSAPIAKPQATETAPPSAVAEVKSSGFSNSFELPPTALGANLPAGQSSVQAESQTTVVPTDQPKQPIAAPTALKPPAPGLDAKAPPRGQLPTGLVLHLTFDPDTVCQRNGKTYVRDTSGKENDFELHNAKIAEGRFGTAFSAEGADYATGSDSALPAGGAPITVSAWLNPRRTQFQIFWSYGTPSPGQARGLAILSRDSVCFFSGEDSCHTRWAPWKANDWQHVVTTFADGQAKFYLDGKLYDTTPGKFNTMLGGMTIGRSLYPSDPSQYSGLIDELAIFDRALSDDEIKSLFEQTPYQLAAPASLSDIPNCN